MTVGTDRDVEGLKAIGWVVSTVLRQMLSIIEPGMRTVELDEIGARLLEQYGARSAPRLTYDFPGATCISINEEAAHGVPGERVIEPGDVVNVDVSAEKDGYFADTGGTGVVPPSSPVKDRLLHATRLALDKAVDEARAGHQINRIGRAVEQVAKQHRFKVIRNLAGHGVGRALHEQPEGILGYFDRRDQRTLTEGTVIAIEPFLSTRSTYVEEGSDGWTLCGMQGNLSAQFEHTLIVTRGRPIVVTAESAG
ncbi:MAG: type I methionyl aminopeptidase [Pseudomonadales bacterium]|jgi:methionyl aminopeptidase